MQVLNWEFNLAELIHFQICLLGRGSLRTAFTLPVVAGSPSVLQSPNPGWTEEPSPAPLPVPILLGPQGADSKATITGMGGSQPSEKSWGSNVGRRRALVRIWDSLWFSGILQCFLNNVVSTFLITICFMYLLIHIIYQRKFCFLELFPFILLYLILCHMTQSQGTVSPWAPFREHQRSPSQPRNNQTLLKLHLYAKFHGHEHEHGSKTRNAEPLVFPKAPFLERKSEQQFTQREAPVTSAG